MSRKKDIDKTDIEMLNILKNHGDITNKEIASLINLSEGPSHKRLKAFREKKIIKEVQAKIDLERLGYVYNVMLTCTVMEEDTDTLVSVLASCPIIKSVYKMDFGKEYTNKRRVAAIAVAKTEDQFVKVFGELFRNVDFKFQFTAHPIEKVVKEDLNITVEKPE